MNTQAPTTFLPKKTPNLDSTVTTLKNLPIGKVNVVPVPPPPPPPGVNEDSSSDSDLGPDLAHLGRPQAAVQGNNTPMQVASTAIQIYEREPNG